MQTLRRSLGQKGLEEDGKAGGPWPRTVTATWLNEDVHEGPGAFSLQSWVPKLQEAVFLVPG